MFTQFIFSCLQMLKTQFLIDMTNTTDRMIKLSMQIMIIFIVWLIIFNFIIFSIWTKILIQQYYQFKLYICLIPWEIIVSEPNVLAQLKKIIIEHKSMKI